MLYPVYFNENYLVYPSGKVFSVRKEIYLKQCMSKSGYLVIGSKLGSVHRMLAECFLGGIPDGMVINHKDGNKINNELSNLEIVTASENIRHAFRTGLAEGQPGENNSMAKLTNELARKMCLDFLDGKSNMEIGLKYKLHSRYVSLVRHGHRWSDLYIELGPFPKSHTPDKFELKYAEFLELKDTLSNKEIAILVNVDQSTVSRWRSGESRGKSSATTIETTSKDGRE